MVVCHPNRTLEESGFGGTGGVRNGRVLILSDLRAATAAVKKVGKSEVGRTRNLVEVVKLIVVKVGGSWEC